MSDQTETSCELESAKADVSETIVRARLFNKNLSGQVYRHFGHRTLRTQDTSDLPKFGPRTLRH